METPSAEWVMVLFVAIILFVALMHETTTATPAVPASDYPATWEWCGDKFPHRDDLQEACRWGAYEMLPGQDVEVGHDA